MRKLAGYIALCLIWGTTWMAIKVGLKDLTPFFSLGIRFLLSAALTAAYLLLREKKITFEKTEVKLMLSITFFNYVIPYSLVYWGQQFINSNLTAVLYATMPLNIALLSPFFLLKERLTRYDYAGMLIGFTGTVIIFAESLFAEQGFHLRGILAVFMASVLSAVIAIILKNYKKEFHPLKINFLPMLLTGIIVTATSFLVEDVKANRWSPQAVWSVLYLTVFGTVIAFGIYFWMIQKIRLLLLSSITYVIPVIAIIMGWIFLKERLTPYQIVGALLVLIGVFIATRRPDGQLHT